jgi:hypothetical protein
MNAGGEDRGGNVSGFTGGYMGGCWIGSVGIVLGVCRGGGTTGGAGGGSCGSIVGVGIGGGVSMRRVGKRSARPERRTRGVTADRRVRVGGGGRGCGVEMRRVRCGRAGGVRLLA